MTPAPWQELLRVEEESVRTNTVGVGDDPLLLMLGDTSARLLSEINYGKRHLFFRGELRWDRIREVDSKILP